MTGFEGNSSAPWLVGSAHVLAQNTSAIPVLPAENGELNRLGLITQLPVGTQILIGGPGFAEGTVRVECGGASYFMFVDELFLTAVAHA